MSYSARFNKSGNVKLGNMYSFSKLKGNKEYSYNGETVKGTCGRFCAGCEIPCYVTKSYRYPSVIAGHARNTIAFRTQLEESFIELEQQLDRAKNKPIAVRINQSGELETVNEFLSWVVLACNHSGIEFYVYSKNYDIIVPYIEKLESAGEMPKNFTVLVSIWHEIGIKEFFRLAKYDCVKAFVYCDGFDYSMFGLVPDTWCKAYDENGKLNHEITCQRCQKCFDKCIRHKIIFCNDH